MHKVCISAFILHMTDCDHNRLLIVWTVHPLYDFVNTRVQMALGLGATWVGL